MSLSPYFDFTSQILDWMKYLQSFRENQKQKSNKTLFTEKIKIEVLREGINGKEEITSLSKKKNFKK